MSNFSAVFCANILYLLGVHIFKVPETEPADPILAYLINLLSFSLIITEIGVYPGSLRRPYKCCYFAAECLIAVFFLEHIIENFWLPVEIGVLSGLSICGVYIENSLYVHAGSTCGAICGFLKGDSKTTRIFCSYLLSFILLIITLHITRYIDLRLLEKGIMCFVEDVQRRIKRGFKRLLRKVIKKKKHVRITEPTNRRSDCQVPDTISEAWLEDADYYNTSDENYY